MYTSDKFAADEFELPAEHESFDYGSEFGGREAEASRFGRDYIKWVQQSLNQIMRLQLTVDGSLGPQTRSAIRGFQQRQGLVVDGIVGAKTEAAIRIALGSSGLPAAQRIGPEAQPRGGQANATATASCEVIDEFDFNSTIVKEGHPHHQSQLNRILAQLIATASQANNRVAVRFIGHTDRVGNDAYNDQLGLKRANSVRSVLMRKLQAQPNLMSRVDFKPAETRGERERLPDNARSRRVQVCFPVVQPKPTPAPPAQRPTVPPPQMPPLIKIVRASLRKYMPVLGWTGLKLPTTVRFLNANEKAEATKVFTSSLDFSRILIADGLGFQGRPFTVAVPSGGRSHTVMLLGDLTSWHTPSTRSEMLIHELTHAWQSQHASSPTAFMENSVRCQAAALLAAAKRKLIPWADSDEFSAYAYVPGKPFRAYAA